MDRDNFDGLGTLNITRTKERNLIIGNSVQWIRYECLKAS